MITMTVMMVTVMMMMTVIMMMMMVLMMLLMMLLMMMMMMTMTLCYRQYCMVHRLRDSSLKPVVLTCHSMSTTSDILAK